MLFFDDNLLDPLPLGTLDHLGIPYETYTLALTETLLNDVLGGKFSAEVKAELDDAGVSGYLSGNDLAGTVS